MFGYKAKLGSPALGAESPSKLPTSQRWPLSDEQPEAGDLDAEVEATGWFS